MNPARGGGTHQVETKEDANFSYESSTAQIFQIPWTRESRLSNAETRKLKESRNPKAEVRNPNRCPLACCSDFGFRRSFGLGGFGLRILRWGLASACPKNVGLGTLSFTLSNAAHFVDKVGDQV